MSSPRIAMPVRLCAGMFLALCFGATLQAAQPSWWDGEVLADPNTTAPASENYAPANLGQLKNMAKRAKAHLDMMLPGGAGGVINAMVEGFSTSTPENYAPINIGQLKAVAKPFYDRLLIAGYSHQLNLIARGYPSDWEFTYAWNPTTAVQQNYAPANIGQLKMAFSFDAGGFSPDFSVDSDGDGIPDVIEIANGLDPNSPDPVPDFRPPLDLPMPLPPPPPPPPPAGLVIENGTFHSPKIGQGMNPVTPDGWDYFSNVPGWTAVNGSNIEYQNFGPLSVDGCGGQYCELRAHPEGNGGIRQTLRTRIGTTYGILFNFRGRMDSNPATDNRFTVRIDGDVVPVELVSGTVTEIEGGAAWEWGLVQFTATEEDTDLAFVPVANPAAPTQGIFLDNIIRAPNGWSDVPISGHLSDVDGDGLPCGVEETESPLGTDTDPNNPDTDGDGILDGKEFQVFRAGVQDPTLDDDGWQLFCNGVEVASNDDDVTRPAIGIVYLPVEERALFTIQSTDHDGAGGGATSEEYKVFFSNFDGSLPMRWIAESNNSPLEHTFITTGAADTTGFKWGFFVLAPDPDSSFDSDGDELSDTREAEVGSDPANPDTDNDGLLDGEEVGEPLYATGTSPLLPDSDNNGISDRDEFLKVVVAIRDPSEQPDAAWSVFCNGTFVVSNASDPSSQMARKIFLLHRQMAAFTIERIEVDQARITDDYELALVDGDDLSRSPRWVALPANPPMSGSLSYNGWMVPRTSNLVWRFHIKGKPRPPGEPPTPEELEDDADDDGMPDEWEVAHNVSDPLKDHDNDGLTNLLEYLYGTHPRNNDSDSDGMPDGWEVQYQFDPTNPRDAGQDADQDRLVNLNEYLHGTHPRDPDSDGDLFYDGYEVGHGKDPTNGDENGNGISDGNDDANGNNFPDATEQGNWVPMDTDGDGLSDWLEEQIGTSPTNPDTDGDGLTDREENDFGSPAPSNDSDGDGWTNAEEILRGTNPFLTDTDGDGVADSADRFPLDPSRSSLSGNPSDTTAPGITITKPSGVTFVP